MESTPEEEKKTNGKKDDVTCEYVNFKRIRFKTMLVFVYKLYVKQNNDCKPTSKITRTQNTGKCVKRSIPILLSADTFADVALSDLTPSSSVKVNPELKYEVAEGQTSKDEQATKQFSDGKAAVVSPSVGKIAEFSVHKSTTQTKSPPLIFAWMPCGYRSHDCNSQPTGPITKPGTVEDLFVMDFDPSYRGGHRLVPLVGTNLPSTCPLTP
ncbi:hypothetical protein RUM44_000503 [Polyplax serrata]|uniref:Uncharacterized protein n=1 Tax=Polyplax serrata TaxID=468196 RepID=A0ABR1B6R4_POLSC